MAPESGIPPMQTTGNSIQFQAGRIAERADIVAWIRATYAGNLPALNLAQDIQAGCVRTPWSHDPFGDITTEGD
jgi:hypothetical protein